MNSSIVNVAVPVIRKDFGVSEAQVGWVITAYLLLYAVGIPLYGRASDVFSLRRAFSLGLLVFALGSLLCALRSEEHTSELQSRQYLVCRLLLAKKTTAISSTPYLLIS